MGLHFVSFWNRSQELGRNETKLAHGQVNWSLTVVEKKEEKGTGNLSGGEFTLCRDAGKILPAPAVFALASLLFLCSY